MARALAAVCKTEYRSDTGYSRINLSDGLQPKDGVQAISKVSQARNADEDEVLCNWHSWLPSCIASLFVKTEHTADGVRDRHNPTINPLTWTFASRSTRKKASRPSSGLSWTCTTALKSHEGVHDPLRSRQIPIPEPAGDEQKGFITTTIIASTDSADNSEPCIPMYYQRLTNVFFDNKCSAGIRVTKETFVSSQISNL